MGISACPATRLQTGMYTVRGTMHGYSAVSLRTHVKAAGFGSSLYLVISSVLGGHYIAQEGTDLSLCVCVCVCPQGRNKSWVRGPQRVT